MKKTALILTAILLIGCGTVKKSSEETEIKKDSASSSKKEWNLSTGDFIIKPFNPDKPIVHTNSEGKTDTFYNTIIENHYRTEYLKVKDTTNVKGSFKKEQTSKEVDYSKLIDSAFKHIIYLILILLIAMWLYRSFNPIELVKKLFKNKTPLI